MNYWECDQSGCQSKSHGIGGAIGLRAIGWYFKKGEGITRPPIIFCPQHSPLRATQYKEVEKIQNYLREVE